MTIVLTAQCLKRNFGKVSAVAGLDISLLQGEIFGLIGPDGAGKTTTLRMLIGAVEPDEGDVIIKGISVNEQPEKAREFIGYMPQSYGLYQDLTVEENIIFFGELQGVKKNILSARITELLEFVKLNQFRKRRVGNLSGGMYKKLAVACSIIHSPEILILDEPTNGVDPVSRRDLWSLLFRLSAQGVAILISTPYMDEAERCTRVGLLVDGRMLQEGDPGEMTNRLKGRLYQINCDRHERSLAVLRELSHDIVSFQAGSHIRFFSEDTDPKLMMSAFRKAGCPSPEPVSPVFEDVFMRSILRERAGAVSS
jgi:ABC-2 type transport system ATP-binding protein